MQGSPLLFDGQFDHSPNVFNNDNSFTLIERWNLHLSAQNIVN